ncbi:MAG: M23 family metallopeptidase [Bacteroidales bacterium]
MTNVFVIIIASFFLSVHVYLPINTRDRNDISGIHLTEIGQFGLMRKARPNVPKHYHTGVDIMRPNSNYTSEPIYPIASGVIISKRTDGPYANLIIVHTINGRKIWSLYEHIAGIKVGVDDSVSPNIPIARFMSKEELNRYGWQFNHFHLEVLKVKPLRIKPTANNLERFYNSYSLICFTREYLDKYYYDPLFFFRANFK